MKRKFYLPLFLISLLGLNAFAQTGEIKGRILEKGTKDGVPFASVAALLGGTQVQAAVTDIDGNYTIKPLNPGKYDVKATCVGFNAAERTGVIVSTDKMTFVDIELGKGIILKEVEVSEYVKPLIDKGNPATQFTATFDEIQAAPVRDVNSIASTSAGVYQRDEGDALNIRGSRSDATAYYVDGIKVRGGVGVSNKGTEQITVITGGVPAQYGDATGGIISVTTRGPSKEFTGGIEVASSRPFDEYDNNIVSFDLAGPIFTKRDSVGRKSGMPMAGFFVAGDYYFDGDPNPSAIGTWVVKDDKLAEIQKTPLIKSQTGTGFNQQAEFLTYDDLQHVKARPNAASKGYRVNGKLDFRPLKNVTLTFGGSYDHNEGRNYIGIYALMNSANNSQTLTDNWRVFGKVTQRFGSSESQSKASASSIKNAYYSIQVDYSKNNSITQNDKHLDRIFDYGYIGQFVSTKTPFYAPGTDTLYDGNGSHIIDTDSLLYLYYDSNVDFHPSDLNPTTANYTTDLYTNGATYHNIFEIQQAGGLLNQDNRANLNVYGLWASTGRIQNYYGKADASQFRVTASGSADIKKHNIVVGLEYEQRIDRSYGLSASSLWSLMRSYEQQNTLNMTQMDTTIHVITNANGDTTGINYDVLYTPTTNVDGEVVPGFHENIHQKLGIPNNGYVDIDAYSPSTYSLDLFSADELAPIVGYYGYDYKGNLTTSNPSISDFYFKKDANKNYTREIGAFQPNYIAGYIQDKFTFNDLIFNIGIRVDRFDANQKALKDKYLLWPAHTAGDAAARLLGNIPDNIKDDYTVYVNDYKSPTSIVGFRKDDKWYDAQGSQINDVSALVNVTGGSGSTIQPWLINPSDASGEHKKIDLNAFKDYEPQTTIMPRIAFSFPISDEANFSAHYDILTQRPESGLLRFNPYDYLYMLQGQAGTISNPDLKPSRTTDYEIRFEQKLSKSSAFSLSAFYKELRDMTEIIAVNYAFPVNYYTYGNVDFGTVKGLTFSYDLRRTGNLRLNASYTLQFADGTGSDPGSNGAILSSAGQSNLRETKPLDFDQRHTFVTTVDFHYGSGKDYDGPKWFNKQVLAKAGLYLTFRAGSGTPYTRQSNITPTADFTSAANGRSVVAGSVNGSRLPWQFRIDAKVDKSFDIKMGKKKDGESRKPLSLNVYLQMLNVLDAMNVTGVYRATGNPGDDGYLSSPEGIAQANGQISPQSFVDLYQIAVNNPGNYSLPRRIRLGLQLNF
ncbi:MAG: TonB-dependent receptor [Bacteroidetes bacterium]|nr:TonB-dependent receptor [Bacteroidota bacterium]